MGTVGATAAEAEMESVAAVVHDVMSHQGGVGHALTLPEVAAVLAAAF